MNEPEFKNESKFAHLTKVHPCFSEKMHDKVVRAHVPIAPRCNIQCNFCTREINKCENRPGVSARVMNVQDAVDHVEQIIKEMPIKVVGVAGPGDALANPETFEFFKIIDKKFPDLIKCLSTNGNAKCFEDTTQEIFTRYFNLVDARKNQKPSAADIETMHAQRREWVRYTFMENRFIQGGVK